VPFSRTSQLPLRHRSRQTSSLTVHGSAKDSAGRRCRTWRT
jgi:hypothetical protein